MTAVQGKYGDEIQVVAVNVYDGDRPAIEQFVDEYELRHVILMHGDRVYRGTYRGRGIPQTYLISPEGEITYAHRGWDGDQDRVEIESQIDRLLADH